jgi:uncharacterized protein (DUF1800 family)
LHEEAGVTQKKGLSRRVLVGGLVGAGIAVAAGGVAGAAWKVHEDATASGGATPIVAGQQAQQIGHLLRRAGFGANASDMASYAQLGFQGAVDRLLNYNQVSDDALEQRLKSMDIDLQKPQDQMRWWLLRMAWTQRPLLEKMVLFWHGVLTSSIGKIGGKQGYMRMIVQNNFFRAHAFDTFDNILLGITKDPAMLIYLDLTTSHKNAPNENYARELMELFTLGLGNYTQQDVRAAALALTGWHVNGPTSSRYNPKDHSDETVTFLGHTGQLNYQDVITILTNHPAAGPFICRKLFTFFVHENPTDADLQPLVDTYHSSQHNMGAVMRTLLLSPQFSSSQAYRSRIKSPVEFTVGVYRGLEMQSSGKELPPVLINMGQKIFDPPNVAGWPGDKVSALWLNSGTWMVRLNYVNQALIGSKNSANPYKADLQNIINSNHLASPEQFVDYFASFMLDGQLDPQRRTQLLEYMTAKETRPASAQITLADGKAYSASRVQDTLYLLMASPEYQLN